MHAILMAGGKGTRLRPYTAVLPKPLVPIGEMSILELVLKQLRHYNFSRVTICVGHKAELIMAVVGDGDRFGLSIDYVREERPLGTIGALKLVPDVGESFLVMNGDICTNLPFDVVLQEHVKAGSLATIATYRRREAIEFGVLDIDRETSRVVGFREKPIYDFSVCMGVNAFRRDVMTLIPDDQYFGFDMLLDRLLADHCDVRSYAFEGRWLDIGRVDDYERMIDDFAQNPKLYLPFDSGRL